MGFGAEFEMSEKEKRDMPAGLNEEAKLSIDALSANVQ